MSIYPASPGFPPVSLETQLLNAARQSDSAAVRALLEAGADVDALDDDEKTALMHAARRGNSAIVEELLAAGASPNASDERGQTALIIAAQDGKERIVVALLAAHADPNAYTNTSSTALMGAASWDNEKIVEALLRDGADPNASNSNGRTALMNAAREGRQNNVRALLSAGADPYDRDQDGQSACDMARTYRDLPTIDLIQRTIKTREEGWRRETHADFPSGLRQTVEILIAASSCDEDKTPRHPNSPFAALPLELIYEIIAFIDPYESKSSRRYKELLRLGDLLPGLRAYDKKTIRRASALLGSPIKETTLQSVQHAMLSLAQEALQIATRENDATSYEKIQALLEEITNPVVK